jgi:hypothetical protein
MEGVNLRYIVRTFVNVTMYSQYNKKKKERKRKPPASAS